MPNVASHPVPDCGILHLSRCQYKLVFDDSDAAYLQLGHEKQRFKYTISVLHPGSRRQKWGSRGRAFESHQPDSPLIAARESFPHRFTLCIRPFHHLVLQKDTHASIPLATLTSAHLSCFIIPSVFTPVITILR